MNAETVYSEEEILEKIDQADKENFILANIARMVYYAGFRKNEIMEAKIGHVLDQGTIVPEIQPFLNKTTKAYTSAPISLDQKSKSILDDHIKNLKRCGYGIGPDDPLFLDKKTGGKYHHRTLARNLKEYFEEITFDKLRRSGAQRKEIELRKQDKPESQVKRELQDFSRHSRLDTTRRLINGDVQKAGKPKKELLPWERIVILIEKLSKYVGLPSTMELRGISTKKIDKEKLQNNYLNIIKRKISRMQENDVRQDLASLLHNYYLDTIEHKTSRIQQNDVRQDLASVIHNYTTQSKINLSSSKHREYRK